MKTRVNDDGRAEKEAKPKSNARRQIGKIPSNHIETEIDSERNEDEKWAEATRCDLRSRFEQIADDHLQNENDENGDENLSNRTNVRNF